MIDTTLSDCRDCYNQYKVDKTFNYDCPFYDRDLSIEKDKCIWIDVIEREINNFERRLRWKLNKK